MKIVEYVKEHKVEIAILGGMVAGCAVTGVISFKCGKHIGINNASDYFSETFFDGKIQLRDNLLYILPFKDPDTVKTATKMLSEDSKYPVEVFKNVTPLIVAEI
jgi:hypothetical protein